MGAAHARWLAESVAGCELTAVYDIDACRAEFVGAECGARLFDDPVTLIKDDDVDAVVVARQNANGSRAESGPWVVSVGAELIRLYADYLHGEYGGIGSDYDGTRLSRPQPGDRGSHAGGIRRNWMAFV